MVGEDVVTDSKVVVPVVVTGDGVTTVVVLPVVGSDGTPGVDGVRVEGTGPWVDVGPCVGRTSAIWMERKL